MRYKPGDLVSFFYLTRQYRVVVAYLTSPSGYTEYLVVPVDHTAHSLGPAGYWEEPNAFSSPERNIISEYELQIFKAHRVA